MRNKRDIPRYLESHHLFGFLFVISVLNFLIGASAYRDVYWLVSSILIVLTTAVTYGISLKKKEFLNILRGSLPGVFSFSFALFILIPMPQIVRHGIGPLNTSAFEFIFASVAVYWLVLIPTLLFPPIRRHPPVSSSFRLSLGFSIINWAMFLYSALVLTYFVSVLRGDLPILIKLHGGSPTELLLSRQGALAGRSGSLLAYSFESVRNFVLPVLAGASVYAARKNQSIVIWLYAYLVCGIAITASALTMEKSPVIRIFIILILVFLLASEQVSFKRALISGTLLVAIFLALVRINIGYGGTDHEITRVVDAAWSRVIEGPSVIASDHFAWTQDVLTDISFGRGTKGFNKLLTDAPIDAAGSVYSWVDKSVITNGSANASFHTQLWQDFGWMGIIAGGLIVGFGLIYIERAISRIRSSGFRYSLNALFIVQTGFLTLTAATSSIFSFGFGALDLLIVVLAYQYLAARELLFTKIT